VANAFNFMMEDLRTSKERLVIAERIAAWQEIARRLAHEINNPLTPIQMAMDTLRKTCPPGEPGNTRDSIDANHADKLRFGQDLDQWAASHLGLEVAAGQ
jgi:nitrogen-specific signal transduction histidine kinase